MMKKLLLIIICLLQIGCFASKRSSTDFPIVKLVYRDHTTLVNLISNFGYIVDWPENKQPTFYVFNRKKHTRVKTDQWETFIQELKQLPGGIEIDEIGKCTVPFSWGMPETQKKELQQVLASKSIKIIDKLDHRNHVNFCYCEAINFHVLSDEER
ncbi:MAG: hypothetical protein P8X63_09975 [Desulfuromonadaceae bacterium]